VLLGLLDEGHEPLAVVCNPDRPVGRKKIITPPLVKQLVTSRGNVVPLLQPEEIDNDFLTQLSKFHADVFVVAAYAKILPQALLDIPTLGVIGVHPSLLPRYRGASPIQSALLASETTTGVTLYEMDSKMDHGPVYISRELSVDSGTYCELQDRLAALSSSMVLELFESLSNGSARSSVQNHAEATFTGKFVTEDGYVSPMILDKAVTIGGEEASMIERKIRALNPEPGVYTFNIKKKRIKLLRAVIENKKLKLIKIQLEGRKPQML